MSGLGRCCECDALPGECEHDGRRYLPPIVYERVSGDEPKETVWRIPDHEQERFWNGPRLPSYALGPRVDARPEPEEFGPVGTETGELMRRTGIEQLSRRIEQLEASTSRRRLSTKEERELRESHRALQTLRSMAPVGALLPSGTGTLSWRVLDGQT